MGEGRDDLVQKIKMNRTVLGAVAILLCCLGTACGSMGSSLPVYTTEQTDSARPGYRRTTVSTAGASYVNDFEEQSLQLIETDPKLVVGRSQFGNGKICAIAGLDPSEYLSVDVGSEMPAYEVFRNSRHPPFDWRHAAFQRMRLAMSEGPAANKETTDPMLIEDVLRTLRDGTPATPPVEPPAVTASGSPAGVYGVMLFSDQIPGLIFRPSCYIEKTGQVYLADSLLLTFTRTQQSVQARWIPASPLFAQWVQTR
jgi:hypothetical protein